MPITDVRQKYDTYLVTLGKRVLNLLFPNDFEYYLISFELVDSTGKTVDFITFPVLPSSFKEEQTEYTNIKKSAGGITSLFTTSFVPKRITMKGNFGRSFKFLIGNSELSIVGLRFSTLTGVYKKEDIYNNNVIKNVPFSPVVKSGYGVTKLLEAILDKSTALDANNKPMKLFFYNPALGNNYLVEVNSKSFSQNNSSENMIWNYDLSLTAIAPISALKDTNKISLVRNMSYDTINKGVQKLRSSLKVQSVSPTQLLS